MKTLTEALERITQHSTAMEPIDLVKNLDHYEFRFNNSGTEMHPFNGDTPLVMQDLALRQVASKAGVPYQYLRNCPPNLAHLNLNYWIQQGQYKRESLLRTVRGNQVRAVLSDAYVPMDDQDIMPMVVDALGGEDAQVQLLDLGEQHTHIRILFPRITTEAKPGDIIQAGLHISNSEVGLRAIQIESLVYRLICTNGAVAPERGSRMTARHVGNPARLKDFITGAVRDAQAGTARLLQAFRASVQYRLEDPIKLIERTSQDGSLSQEQFKRIVSSFAQDGSDPTLYGVVNAFTHAAQAENLMEERYQMERLGSSLLRLVA